MIYSCFFCDKTFLHSKELTISVLTNPSEICKVQIRDVNRAARARPDPIQNLWAGPSPARFKIFSPSPARPDSKFWTRPWPGPIQNFRPRPGPARFKIFGLDLARPDSKFSARPWPDPIQNFRPRPGPFWFKYVGPIWNLQLKSVLLEINFEHRLKVYSKIILSSGYLNVVRFFGRRRRGRLILSLHL